MSIIPSPFSSKGALKQISLISHYWTSISLVAFLELNLPSLLAPHVEGITADDLAQQNNWNAGRLYRLLNHVQYTGVIKSQVPDPDADAATTVLWYLTEEGSMFRPDDPSTLESIVLLECGPLLTLSTLPEIIADIVRTPILEYEGIFQRALKQQGSKELNPFVWMQEPQNAKTFALFNKTMSCYSNLDRKSLLGFYGDRFSKLHTLVDVGGNIGTLVGYVLQAYPSIKNGVVADLQVGAMGAKVGEIDRFGVADRARFLPIDFFEPSTLPAIVPQDALAADAEWAVTMKNILHGWDDAKTLIILKNLRDAILSVPKASDKFTLCIIEGHFIPASYPSAETVNWISAGMDVHMMKMGGGMQRSLQQWNTLFKQSGWKLNRICVGDWWLSVVEATIEN